jgi:hypothetical protein
MQRHRALLFAHGYKNAKHMYNETSYVLGTKQYGPACLGGAYFMVATNTTRHLPWAPAEYWSLKQKSQHSCTSLQRLGPGFRANWEALRHVRKHFVT